jgi:putative phosphoribosyl transferase
MYFANRAEAGRKLAAELLPYQVHNVSVVALSRGAVIVGAQIAIKLHANLMMLLTENITLPGIDAFAAVTSDNHMTYNKSFYTGEIEELSGEYFHYIEQQRLEKIHRLHRLLDAGGEVKPELLKNHIVIVVSDGFSTGFSIDVAADFLKPIKVKKLVVAAPIASLQAVDRMHLVGDEVVCLSVTENYIETGHYYDENAIPDTPDLFKIIQNISLSWDRQAPQSTQESRSKHHIG